jgi:hypothetical protein
MVRKKPADRLETALRGRGEAGVGLRQAGGAADDTSNFGQTRKARLPRTRISISR